MQFLNLIPAPELVKSSSLQTISDVFVLMVLDFADAAQKVWHSDPSVKSKPWTTVAVEHRAAKSRLVVLIFDQCVKSDRIRFNDE